MLASSEQSIRSQKPEALHPNIGMGQTSSRQGWAAQRPEPVQRSPGGHSSVVAQVVTQVPLKHVSSQ